MQLAGRDDDIAALTAALTRPGLAVIAGPPGIGKSALARAAAGVDVRIGGGLRTLRHRSGLAVSTAIRAALPTDDPALAVEAVRARIGGAVLLLDDIQWADPLTLDLLPRIAAHCRVLVALRTPAPLVDLAPLRQAAACWRDLAPLDDADAEAVVRRTVPTLDATSVADVVARGEGNPGLLTLFAQHGKPIAAGRDGLAALVAELSQAERTALAGLGLLGRPAPIHVLGSGGRGLLDRDLAVQQGDGAVTAPASLSEVAAGLLPDDLRQAMRRRLAELIGDDAEAARQLTLAGDTEAAAAAALRAAEAAASPDERANCLALAAGCTGAIDTTLAAARAALVAGRPHAAAALLDGIEPTAPVDVVTAAVLHASVALTEGNDATALLEGVRGELHAAPAELVDEHTAISVRATTQRDPREAARRAAVAIRRGEPSARLLTAYGEALRAAGDDDWAAPVRQAIERADGLADRCVAAALLVAGLRESLDNSAAASTAESLATECAAAAAYSWEVIFRTEALWATLHTTASTAQVSVAGRRLLARELPRSVGGLLRVTVALALADAGELDAARGTVEGVDSRLATWVGAEVSLLDGSPAGALAVTAPLVEGVDLAGLLARLTMAWAGGEPPPSSHDAVATSVARSWAKAATAWRGVLRREEVRCLVAVDDANALTAAERLCADGGLVLLAGQVQRAMRAHGLAPRTSTTPSNSVLSTRERQVLQLVGEGLTSRRIADRLGLTAQTVDSYVKAAIQKLGVRSRTEAAILVQQGKPA